MEQPSEGELLREIASAIRGIRFGSVEIVIHDSRVVQVERREKVRVIREVALFQGADRTTGGAHTRRSSREHESVGNHARSAERGDNGRRP